MFVLVRTKKNGNECLGNLYYNGSMICFTLENDLKKIPTGVYKLQNSISPKFKRTLPLVFGTNVPASRGIRIHRGNNAVKDSAGCILVGMVKNESKKSKITISRSEEAEIMVTVLCDFKERKLVITDDYT